MTAHNELTNEEASLLAETLGILIRKHGKALITFRDGTMKIFDPAQYEMTREDMGVGCGLAFDHTKWALSGNRLVPVS